MNVHRDLVGSALEPGTYVAFTIRTYRNPMKLEIGLVVETLPKTIRIVYKGANGFTTRPVLPDQCIVISQGAIDYATVLTFEIYAQANCK